MAAKVAHTVRIDGNAPAALSRLETLVGMKPHKWIPLDEIRSEARATVTPRQAAWLAAQVAKKVEGTTLVLEPAPAAPVAA